jgi:hypothetical protein
MSIFLQQALKQAISLWQRNWITFEPSYEVGITGLGTKGESLIIFSIILTSLCTAKKLKKFDSVMCAELQETVYLAVHDTKTVLTVLQNEKPGAARRPVLACYNYS